MLNARTVPEPPFDYLLVGGGLQSGLMAMAINHYQPRARVAIVERDAQLAGNHTWSFHRSDIPSECEAWATPCIESQWPQYEILVGGRRRLVHIPYATCSSTHFATTVTAQLRGEGCKILTNTNVSEVLRNCVRLSDGTELRGTVVLDNRGPLAKAQEFSGGGFQKFWGFEVQLSADWPTPHPIVMDDRIDQTDGFRFVYSLPFEPRRVLVEDTRFSNSSSIQRSECLQHVTSYLAARRCTDWTIVREEHGVLPMPTGGILPGSSLPELAGGYRGGWFHAATGYSFPLAIQVAQAVATTPPEQLLAALQGLSRQQAGRARFARFLNRLLFDLVSPQSRYQIFRRFYRVLDEPAIARFYGHRFTRTDAFRIVVGWPPGGLRPLNFARSLLTRRSTLSSHLHTHDKRVPA